MILYKHEKTHNYIAKRRGYVDVKKYMVTTDEVGQKYALFQLVNNYHDTLKRIVVEVKQYDANKNLIFEMDIPYDGLMIKSHCKFVPYFKLMIDKSTEKIETKVKEAYFEDHTFKNGLMKKNKKVKKVVEEDKKVDKINKKVNVLTTDAPRKSFLVMSAIILCIIALFVASFSLKNKIHVEDDFAIDITSGEITKYYGDADDIVIPEEVSGVKVLSIGNRAFSNGKFRTVNIQAPNVEIDDYAFMFCQNLESINAKNISVINNYAFENCSNLMYIDASNIEKIGEGAFMGCSSLEYFESVTLKEVDRYAFNNCSALSNFYAPNAELEIMVFSNCFSLSDITFGSVASLQDATLKRIFSNEIDYHNTTVNLNMNYITKYFIGDFKFKKINFINPQVVIDKQALSDLITKAKNQGSYEKNNIYEKVFDTIIDFYPQNIGNELILSNNSIRGILLDAFSKIGPQLNSLTLNCNLIVTKELMSKCTNVTSLILGKSIIVEEGALSYRLKELKIGVQNTKFKHLFSTLPIGLSLELTDFEYDGGDEISENYFESCSSINDIKVVGNFNMINKNAFSGCTGLKKLEIIGNITNMTAPIIGGNIYGLTNVTLPYIGTDQSTPIKYKELNESYGFTKTLKLSSTNATKLVESCFEGCVIMKTLYIERGVAEGSSGCLKGLNLDNLYLGKNLGLSLVDLFGVPTKISNVCISDLQGNQKEYFSGVQIYNLFIENSNITDTSFGETDQIANMMISNTCYGSYEASLEKMTALQSINFQKLSGSYQFINKMAVYGYDYSNNKKALFN